MEETSQPPFERQPAGVRDSVALAPGRHSASLGGRVPCSCEPCANKASDCVTTDWGRVQAMARLGLLARNSSARWRGLRRCFEGRSHLLRNSGLHEGHSRKGPGPRAARSQRTPRSIANGGRGRSVPSHESTGFGQARGPSGQLHTDRDGAFRSEPQSQPSPLSRLDTAPSLGPDGSVDGLSRGGALCGMH